jgi:hypothetical protein
MFVVQRLLEAVKQNVCATVVTEALRVVFQDLLRVPQREVGTSETGRKRIAIDAEHDEANGTETPHVVDSGAAAAQENCHGAVA